MEVSIRVKWITSLRFVKCSWTSKLCKKKKTYFILIINVGSKSKDYCTIDYTVIYISPLGLLESGEPV